MARTATIVRETSESKVELSLNLDGTGKTDGKTGISDVQKRRMKNKRDILQHRIEIPPLERRRKLAGERIGRENNEKRKSGDDYSQDG